MREIKLPTEQLRHNGLLRREGADNDFAYGFCISTIGTAVAIVVLIAESVPNNSYIGGRHRHPDGHSEWRCARYGECEGARRAVACSWSVSSTSSPSTHRSYPTVPTASLQLTVVTVIACHPVSWHRYLRRQQLGLRIQRSYAQYTASIVQRKSLHSGSRVGQLWWKHK